MSARAIGHDGRHIDRYILRRLNGVSYFYVEYSTHPVGAPHLNIKEIVALRYWSEIESPMAISICHGHFP